MAFMLIETPENMNTVSRPISRQVVREVARRLGIDEDTPIYNPGYLGSTKVPGTMIGGEPQPEEDYVGDDGLAGITIQLEEEYDEDSLFTTALHQSEYPPIFHDTNTGVIVRPVYSATVARLSFDVRFRSRTEAVRWRDHIRHKVSAGQREITHQVSYAYLFPMECMQLIRHIYDLREGNAGYGEEWTEYATQYFTPRLKLLKNLKGNYQSPAISETQSDIIGWWDFELAPDIDPISEAGEKWSVSFEYTYRYDKPTAAATHYPIMVHQQLLDASWIPAIDYVEQEEVRTYSSRTRKALDALRETMEHVPMISGVQLPRWDDWLPKAVMPNTVTIFTALLMKEKEDPTLLVDLSDMGDYEFDTTMLKYLSTHPKKLTVRGNSPIQVELYRDNEIAPEIGVTVGSDLKVRSEEPLNDRSIYHIRVSLLTNLKLLSRTGHNALLRHPKACLLILETLDPGLEKKGKLPEVLGGRYIPSSQFEAAADEINTGLLKKRGVLEPIVATVGTFFIGAYRHGDH